MPKLRALICDLDIFGTVGGGQTAFSNICRQNPDIHFTFFGTSLPEASLIPNNARIVLLTDKYRSQIHLDLWKHFDLKIEDIPLKGKLHEFLLAMDFAASVAGEKFDVVEIPDYRPFGGLIPPALRHFGCVIGKVIVALHGTLSAVLSANWAETLTDDELDLLRRMEMLNFRGADLRYGISRPYIREWKNRSGYEAVYLDPQEVLNFDQFDRYRSQTSALALPDIGGADTVSKNIELLFIGRQEKCKGPDIFVDLVASLPRNTYRRAVIIGPEVNAGGATSKDVLRRMADVRGIQLDFITLRREDLFQYLISQPSVVIVPSRLDTFNLGAMEAVQCGVPTLISSAAGISDYLPDAFPGLALSILDPDNISASANTLINLIERNAAERGQRLSYLAAHKPVRLGERLSDVYSKVALPDPEARATLTNLFFQFTSFFDRYCGPELTAKTRFGLQSVLTSLSSNATDSALAERLIDTFDQTMRLRGLAGPTEITSLDELVLSDEQLEKLHRQVAPMCFSGNRVPLYRLLAAVERNRGNKLLYATYSLRCLRLSPRPSPAELSDILGILREAGLEDEALAANWLYGPVCKFEEIANYISTTSRRFDVLPQDDTELFLSNAKSACPRISIIVSLYNALPKLARFFDGLRRLTDRTHRMLEVVFIDSHSSDDTSHFFRSFFGCDNQMQLEFDVVYLRTNKRETIQQAWNRGIKLARGDYLSFLGVDEMNRPDAFDIMASYLDENPEVDWVQGSAIVTEVNSSGSFIRDLMFYNREFDDQSFQIFDTCYIGYVGALYRKSIHERVGYYDPRFRAAGDTEFKNRALPHIVIKTLPLCLGIFLNYPDERTTQSPIAELEDLRAWYLYRTPAGVSYLLANVMPERATKIFWSTLGYKKSYMTSTCTDIELAASVSEYLRRHAPSGESLHCSMYGELAEMVLRTYQVIDNLDAVVGTKDTLTSVFETSGLLERIAFTMSKVSACFTHAPVFGQLHFSNDNRSHQHHYLWPSKSTAIHVDKPVALADIAGPQDFAELLSSCQASDSRVDFERAWATGNTEQLRYLFDESSLDIAIELTPARSDIARKLADAQQNAGYAHSLLFTGISPEEADVKPRRRLYFCGDIRDVRPALAAAKVALVTRDPFSDMIGVSRLVRAVMMGCKVVAEAHVVSHATKVLPAFDWSGLTIADDVGDMFGIAQTLVDEAAAVTNGSLTLDELRSALTSAFYPDAKVFGPAISKTVLSQAFDASRALRHAFERGGIHALVALAKARAGLTLDVARSLVAERNAPILRTSQPIFHALLAEDAAMVRGLFSDWQT